MSENPYASYPSNHDDYGPAHDGPQRLSIPAVLSLVSSIVCCIPGMGVLAVLLGLLGMLSISRSNGRLTGMPAAVVGMALGVLVTVGQVVLAMGAGSLYNAYMVNMTPPIVNIVDGAIAGDVTAVRAEMTIGAAGQITDEEIVAFGRAFEEAYGPNATLPGGFAEWVSAIGEGFARSGAQIQGQAQSVVPVAIMTDAGGVVIFGSFDPGGQPTRVFTYADLFVLLPNGEALMLRDDGPAMKEAIRLNFTPVTSTEFLERALNPATAPPAPPAPPAPTTPQIPAAPATPEQ
jgi:hypothetical protein